MSGHGKRDCFKDRAQCPTKPITHAFLQLETERDRNGFHRLTNRQQYTVEQRTIQFKPDFNPEERYLQKRLGFEILPQHNLLDTIERIDRHQKQISVKGMIDGQYESKSMRTYGTVDDKNSTNERLRAVTKRTTQHDDGVTMSIHLRDTVGGGRGIFSRR